jgi:hypothetical protein
MIFNFYTVALSYFLNLDFLATKKLHSLTRRAVTFIYRQVSWLLGLYPLPSQPLRPVASIKGYTPNYSGGTVPDFNWIP